MIIRVSLLISLTASAGLGGCVAESPEITVSASASTSGCGAACPENSPIVGGLVFHELHRDGVANRQGLRITEFRGANGTPYKLDVRDARLVGLDPASGAIALDTPSILGATIQLKKPNGYTFELEISEVGTLDSFVAPYEPVTTYHFQAHDLTQHREATLCVRPKTHVSWPGSIWDAVVFAGDRYDDRNKTVTVGAGTEGWFNVACAGSSTAKMHFLRYTESAPRLEQPTLPSERQAMLKMLTATYCPRQPGHDRAKAFTVPGEPLQFRVVGRPDMTPWDVGTYEGVWNTNGIVCLEEPRLAVTSQIPQEEADEILSDLDAQCGGARPPRCTALLPTFPNGWETLGLILSANPRDP